ncbi:ROK family protein [Clostridium sp. Marseille-P3244]|uniref:ROK family protein n=1 Tax=Clostridium sp. Marseille-P3244 TaxID=1871020 RepID=UPI0009316915|nr:ROK family protein [Clostridium sp. Marseille-P3244]
MKYLAGIDLGGTNIKFALMNEHMGTVYKKSIPTPFRGSPETVFQAMINGLQSLLQENALTPLSLLGIGIGIPGLTDSRKGLAYEVKFLRWRNIDVITPFSHAFGVPVIAENDGAVNALGECYLGAGKGKQNVILLTLGTGLGCGIVSDGRLLRGRDGVAAETGHMTIDPEGDLCACGRRGCFESCCSATALMRYARRAVLEYPDCILMQYAKGDIFAIDGPMICKGSDSGDPASQNALRIFNEKLSIGLMNLINLLNPDMIILSGGVSAAGDRILRPVRDLVEEKLMHPVQHCEIVTGQLGSDAGSLGACILAAQKIGLIKQKESR